MSLESRIRQHLEASGQSMRALSMQAGLTPKAVSDMLSRPGHRPNRRTLDALGGATGVDLPDAGPRTTYAALLARLAVKTGDARRDRRNTTLASRLRTVLRVAGWVPEVEEVERRRMIDCFARWSPATLDLSPGSGSLPIPATLLVHLRR